MIVDTSAAVAMLRGEPEAQAMVKAMDGAEELWMSAASVLELSIVTRGDDATLVDDFLAAMGIQVLPVDLDQLGWAREAHRRFGRGSGSAAKLNYGDCFSYGAAKAKAMPLLFKGDDFPHTDVECALLEPR